MNLVNLDDVGMSYGTRTVLEGVSTGVAAGQRIGVVGLNGGGKSTLVRILAGRAQPDSGRVTRRGALRIGFLSQEDDLDPRSTVRDVVAGGRHDHDLAGDPGVRQVLRTLLGTNPASGSRMSDRRIATLSGGERRRVALAALLTEDLDLLVLDEPTNHLDMETVSALADLLARRRSSLVVVTHDRWFLDAVCDRTWEVADGHVHEYEGGYAAYVLARAERERVAATEEERRRNRLRKELAWLRRGPPARTSKPKFRIDAANALIADVPPPRDSTQLVRVAGARLGKVVIELSDVTVTVPGTAPDTRRALLDHVTWHLGPGDRFGILGPNGAGKTTLLDVLAGEAGTPDGASDRRSVGDQHGHGPRVTGSVVHGSTVRIGRLSQEHAPVGTGQRLQSAVEEVARSITLADGRELTATQLLERLGFARSRHRVAVADLSGGERRRLQLLRTLLAGPNVLLLDEPTNDLDTESLAALEDVLDGWAGSIVVVSHDRYFVERTTDRQWALLGDGSLVDLPGGVEEYLAGRAAGGAAAPAAREEHAGGAAAARAATKEMARLDRVLSRLTERESRLHGQMAEHATDHEVLRRLESELKDLLAERGAAEEAWLAAAEVAESGP